MSEVCLVTKTWRSGVAWEVQMLTEALAEAGATVTLVAPLAEPVDREPRHPNVKRVRVPRELVDGAGNSLTRKLASLSRMAGGFLGALAQRARTRTYLVTIPDPLPVSLLLFLLLRLSGARLLFIVHDVLPHAWRLPGSLRWLERGAHELSYRLATRLIVWAAPLRDQLVSEFGIPPEKVSVFPHPPLPLGAIPPAPGNGRFLAFGTMRRNKCILEVIEAILLVRKVDPGVTLLLAGEPHAHELDYWAQCQAAMARDPAAFSVEAGYVADAALPGLVAGVDAFITAYRDFDSASGVAVLAALNGRPVLGTGAGSLDEMYALGMAGERIEAPVLAESVAAAILKFRRIDAETWRERAAAGVVELSRTIAWAPIARSYLELIRAT